MKKHDEQKTIGPAKNWRLIGGLFLSMLLLLTVIATATDTETGEGSSAGGFAIASGDTTEVSVQASASEDSASSSATAEAVASNGETATAIAEAWASISGTASAYAQAVATAVAGMGETVYAYAHAEASVSSDGTANAHTVASAGQGTGYDPSEDPSGDGNNGNGKVIIQKVIKRDSMGGFMFGQGAIERYCTFMSQLDDNDSKNDERASYFMNVIAWSEYGFTEKIFEQKYGLNKENCTQIVSNMTKRMEAKNYDNIKKLQSYYTADSTSGHVVSKGIMSEYSVTNNVVSKDTVSEYSIPEYPISGDSLVEDTVYYE